MAILTVGKLKKILENVDDDLIVANMKFATNKEFDIFVLKRALVVENSDREKLLVLNNQGTHWDDDWSKNNGDSKIVGWVDRNTGEYNEWKPNE